MPVNFALRFKRVPTGLGAAKLKKHKCKRREEPEDEVAADEEAEDVFHVRLSGAELNVDVPKQCCEKLRRTASFPKLNERLVCHSGEAEKATLKVTGPLWLKPRRCQSESSNLSNFVLDFNRSLGSCSQQLSNYFLAASQSTVNCAGSGGDRNHLAVPPPPLTFRYSHADHSFARLSDAEAKEVSTSAKRVNFADELGFELVTLSVVTEPSDCPPKFGAALLRALSRLVLPENENDDDNLSYSFSTSSSGSGSKQRSCWQTSFEQPVADYAKFRHKLEDNAVVLENAVVRNDLLKMYGTVRVKNLSFDKRVFVRYTDNNWQSSYRDVDGIYVPGDPGSSFDTFRFELDLPVDTNSCSRIDFCVAFKAGCSGLTQEFWDNNDGQNFTLTSFREKRCPASA